MEREVLDVDDLDLFMRSTTWKWDDRCWGEELCLDVLLGCLRRRTVDGWMS